jgi:hypothetical protein
MSNGIREMKNSSRKYTNETEHQWFSLGDLLWLDTPFFQETERSGNMIGK